MKTVSITLDPSRSDKLAKLSEATKGNMTNVSIAGEHIEFEQPKLSSSKLAQALLNSSSLVLCLTTAQAEMLAS